MKSQLIARVLSPLFIVAFGSAATYTTIDISSYVNSNVTNNPQTLPQGITSGNQQTGILFDVAAFRGVAGTWNPLFAATSVLDVKLNVSGQQSFYALLNNFYGTNGADEYDVTVKATNGDSVTYPSIGGVDTRDYNSYIYTNTIANTTFPWFDNGIGQRLDLREFNLPSSFRSETVSDFIITQRTGDAALFSGLTFNDVPYSSTPEPMSIWLCGAGLATLGGHRFLRRRQR